MGSQSSKHVDSRSLAFFNEGHVAGFTHRAFTKAMGYDDADMQRPLIGICNTYSEINNCNANLRPLADAVKRGVWQAGGFPLEFPTISLGEIYLNPSSMLYRNLAAMDTEEMIRGQPLDGVVLLVNCDKTTPAAVMGMASADVPAMVLSGGPALNGHFRGEIVGACTDCRRLTAEYTAGAISADTYRAAEDAVFRGPGHCMVMGTASTMNSLLEALGIALPGVGATPAVDAQRVRLAEQTGRRIVELARRRASLSDHDARSLRERHYPALRHRRQYQCRRPPPGHRRPPRHRPAPGVVRPHQQPHTRHRQPAPHRAIPDGGSALCRRNSSRA